MTACDHARASTDAQPVDAQRALADGTATKADPARRFNATSNADIAHLILGGHGASELGRSVNKVERLRLLADYTGDPISDEDSAWAVEQADVFVSVICEKYQNNKDKIPLPLKGMRRREPL